ncbi:MAG: dipeptidase [Candidatus Neomarinimicrobiota bacterium]
MLRITGLLHSFNQRILFGLLFPILVASLMGAPGPSRQTTTPDYQPPPAALVEQARRILKEVPLIDGHNDVPWQYKNRVQNHLDRIDFSRSTAGLTPRPMHTDIPRLRAGQVGGQFWSVYIPVELAGLGAARITLEQIDVVHRLIEKYPQDLELALTADDIVRIHKSGKVASLIGMEGGHSIENSLGALRQMYRAGARYMTITHWDNVDWADAATDLPEHDGLTPFGEAVIGEMNRLGMLVDLSHVSEATMNDILDITKAPVIFSHSNAFELARHTRNVTDDVLKRIRKNKGIVMVTFVDFYAVEPARLHGAARAGERARLKSLFPNDSARVVRGMEAWLEEHPYLPFTVADVADHIDYIKKTAGIDYIGIGSDFDGIRSGPIGLKDVSQYPNLLAELLRRGYSEKDVKKVAGLNLLRVFRAVEKEAAKLQRKTAPSDALIEELDKPASLK